ncbi:MAG: NADH-quinone oxidoreductase subunit J [Burkholderiales bacterium]
MTDAFVALFGVLAVVFAAMVLALRQPMRAALALVAHMTCLAAIYAALAVHVVALFQVLIYVGAVMVFMVYTIMLLDDRDPSYRQRFSRSTGVAVVTAGTLAALLLVPALGGTPGALPAGTAAFGFAAFSAEFMRHYWFHFEVATVLLLVGMIAAWTAIREAR